MIKLKDFYALKSMLSQPFQDNQVRDQKNSSSFLTAEIERILTRLFVYLFIYGQCATYQ